MKSYLLVKCGDLLVYKALLVEQGLGASINVRALVSSSGGHYLVTGVDGEKFYVPSDKPPTFSIEKE